jgi:hypothetical protein
MFSSNKFVFKSKNKPNKTNSLWKEKNVTLKEKHLHAKYHALFQLCFTKFSPKKVYIPIQACIGNKNPSI